MKKKIIILLFSLLVQMTNGQSIFPSPGYKTVCPVMTNYYEVRPDAVSLKACKYVWTVTNGTMTPNTTEPWKVGIVWKDEAKIGELSVKIYECGDANANKTLTEKYVIRSLKNEVPQNIQLLGMPLDLCEVSSISVKVDRLAVPNTGGFSDVPQYDADGYEWVLSEPSNWTALNSSELITISPKNLCSAGTIKVRAYINTCNGKSYSEYSKAINLRAATTHQVKAPNGQNTYKQKCGNTSSVTFTVQELSCASSYHWNFPSGWKTNSGAGSGVTTIDPVITLVPPQSGTAKALIEGKVACTAITTPCSFQYGALTIEYFDPPLTTPQFTLNSVKNICSNSSGTIEIKPVPEALNYTWYTVPQSVGFYTGDITLNNLSATSMSPLISTVPNVVGKAPLLTDNKYGVDVFVKANRVKGCAGSPLSSSSIWVGPPAEAHIYNLYIPGYRGVNPVNVQQQALYTLQMDKVDGVTSYSWFLPQGITFKSGQSTSGSSVQIWTPATPGSYVIRCTPHTPCGTTGNQTLTLRIYGLGGEGTPCPHPPCSIGPLPARNTDSAFSNDMDVFSAEVFPNPASTELTISLDENETSLEPYEVSIHNNLNQKVYSITSSNSTLKIPIDQLTPGTYTVFIVNSKGTTYKRIQIVR